MYPLVPGHEIIGVVTEVGSDVKNFKVGDRAGVGCFIDTCRSIFLHSLTFCIACWMGQ